jgi:hypothetical protein
MRTLVVILLVAQHVCFAQTAAESKKLFQLSLAPGISTNGLHPGGFDNFFSLNITSGYSSANYIFEMGIVSNLNVMETRGIQIAGVANVTGSNAYQSLTPKQIEKKKKEGFEANLSGLQIAGLCNIVLHNIFGAQISGGINNAEGAMQGVQIAGIGNTIEKYSFGVQLAGLYNSSVESMDGIQVSALLNATRGGLNGVQISAFNKSGFIEGKNSYESTGNTGLQIGLINHSKSMNGFQIGLINVGGRMQGTQIGLINIFKNGKTPETRDGTSIGLVNMGSSGYLSLYTSELFTTNIEIATGTVKNRRKAADVMEKQIQNSLIYSKNFSFANESSQWAIGYGLKKFFFNRSATPAFSRMKFIAGGIDVLKINQETGKVSKDLSVVARPQILAGTRFHPKNRVFHFFAAVSYNIYHADNNQHINTLINESEKSSKKQWPGLSIGVLVQ